MTKTRRVERRPKENCQLRTDIGHLILIVFWQGCYCPRYLRPEFPDTLRPNPSDQKPDDWRKIAVTLTTRNGQAGDRPLQRLPNQSNHQGCQQGAPWCRFTAAHPLP